MKTQHPCDKDIQEYIFDTSNCSSDIIEHINSCEVCKKVSESYLLLSKELKSQPEPVLEFDLSELILDQLTFSKKESIYNYMLSFIIIMSIGITFFTIYIFRDVFSNMFSANITISNYFIVSITTIISLFLGFDMYRSYYKKINMLKY
ncbi:hypothetical protein [Aquimarina sp. AU58]|uniref:hypothetical protein n=1 Tax=Aquimarina sp. AU58 TaxID=1874112 RepID=UPI000D6DD4DA|nr:hypothetical protein [Aquimarina sp. AU58]